MSREIASMYQLTEDMQRLLELDGDEEADAMLDTLTGQIEKKAENYGNFIAYCEDMAAAVKQRAKELSDRAKVFENKAKNMRERLKSAMLDHDVMKIQSKSFSFTVAPTAGSVEIISPDIIPARFITVIPEQYQPDKTAIREAIKNGEDVPGAAIIPGWALRVK